MIYFHFNTFQKIEEILPIKNILKILKIFMCFTFFLSEDGKRTSIFPNGLINYFTVNNVSHFIL